MKSVVKKLASDLKKKAASSKGKTTEKRYVFLWAYSSSESEDEGVRIPEIFMDKNGRPFHILVIMKFMQDGNPQKRADTFHMKIGCGFLLQITFKVFYEHKERMDDHIVFTLKEKETAFELKRNKDKQLEQIVREAGIHGFSHKLLRNALEQLGVPKSTLKANSKDFMDSLVVLEVSFTSGVNVSVLVLRTGFYETNSPRGFRGDLCQFHSPDGSGKTENAFTQRSRIKSQEGN